MLSLLRENRYQAQTRAVLGVDIVGSGQAPDDLLDPLKFEMETLVFRALTMVDLAPSDALHYRDTGDGMMLAYPETCLVQVSAVVFYLDHLIRERNRYARIPLRARLAVHAGPMDDRARYHRTYIVLSRLINSTVFTDAVRTWCTADDTGEKFGASVIFSSTVWQRVIEPFFVPPVPPARCAQATIEGPDFTDDAHVFAPGLDAEAALTAATIEPLRAVPPATGSTNRALNGVRINPGPLSHP